MVSFAVSTWALPVGPKNDQRSNKGRKTIQTCLKPFQTHNSVCSVDLRTLQLSKKEYSQEKENAYLTKKKKGSPLAKCKTHRTTINRSIMKILNQPANCELLAVEDQIPASCQVLLVWSYVRACAVVP